MRGYVAFFNKEWMEALRTYKVFLILLIFAMIGIINPLTAKMLPSLLENFMPEGMTITLKTPGAVDSWEQFYKNVPQIGYFVIVIMCAGIMAGEFGKGTLIPLLAKGLHRDVVVYAKFTIATLLWSMGYVVCMVLSYGYTLYFWPKDRMKNMPASFFFVWLFGVVLISMLLFMGVMVKHVMGALLGTGAVIVIMLTLQLVPKLEKYNPIGLCSKNMAFLCGEQKPMDYLSAVLISMTLIIGCLLGASCIFKRKVVI